MKPIRTEDCNAVLQLPGGTRENDLPCRTEEGRTHSTWEMTSDERTRVLASHGVVVWLWWPNLVGVSLAVGDAPSEHSERTMRLEKHQEDDGIVHGLTAMLTGDELEEVEAGAHVKLSVDLHPTCPVAVGTIEEGVDG